MHELEVGVGPALERDVDVRVGGRRAERVDLREQLRRGRERAAPSAAGAAAPPPPPPPATRTAAVGLAVRVRSAICALRISSSSRPRHADGRDAVDLLVVVGGGLARASSPSASPPGAGEQQAVERGSAPTALRGCPRRAPRPGRPRRCGRPARATSGGARSGSWCACSRSGAASRGSPPRRGSRPTTSRRRAAGSSGRRAARGRARPAGAGRPRA